MSDTHIHEVKVVVEINGKKTEDSGKFRTCDVNPSFGHIKKVVSKLIDKILCKVV